MPIFSLEQARLALALREAAQAHHEAAVTLERAAIAVEIGGAGSAAGNLALAAASDSVHALDLAGQAVRAVRAAAKAERGQPLCKVPEAVAPRDADEQILEVVRSYLAVRKH